MVTNELQILIESTSDQMRCLYDSLDPLPSRFQVTLGPWLFPCPEGDIHGRLNRGNIGKQRVLR